MDLEQTTSPPPTQLRRKSSDNYVIPKIDIQKMYIDNSTASNVSHPIPLMMCL